jgi:hypothetical protein
MKVKWRGVKGPVTLLWMRSHSGASSNPEGSKSRFLVYLLNSLIVLVNSLTNKGVKGAESLASGDG